MSNDIGDRLSELLSSSRDELEADDALEDVLDVPLEELGEQDELIEPDDSSPLLENAADAREIIETNDPEAVLEAVGLAELPDGSEPASIPEAIAKAPEDELRKLHALVTLATVADLLEESGADSDSDEGEDDWRATLEENLHDLRQTLQAGGDDSQRDTESAPDSDDESGTEVDSEDGSDDEVDSNGESAGGVGSDGESDGEADSSDETDSEDESMLGSTLESVAGTDVEGFSDELESLQDRLEGLRGGETDSSTDKDDGDREVDDGEAEREEADQQEDEDGLLGGGLVGDSDEDSSPGRSTRHSTMPSSGRPDMNAVARLSTMPDRN
ncbi:hypothetical protein [Halostagnicola bangensis]